MLCLTESDCSSFVTVLFPYYLHKNCCSKFRHSLLITSTFYVQGNAVNCHFRFISTHLSVFFGCLPCQSYLCLLDEPDFLYGIHGDWFLWSFQWASRCVPLFHIWLCWCSLKGHVPQSKLLVTKSVWPEEGYYLNMKENLLVDVYFLPSLRLVTIAMVMCKNKSCFIVKSNSLFLIPRVHYDNDDLNMSHSKISSLRLVLLTKSPSAVFTPKLEAGPDSGARIKTVHSGQRCGCGAHRWA